MGGGMGVPVKEECSRYCLASVDWDMAHMAIYGYMDPFRMHTIWATKKTLLLSIILVG